MDQPTQPSDPSPDDLLARANTLLERTRAYELSKKQFKKRWPYYNRTQAQGAKEIIDQLLATGKRLRLASYGAQPATTRNKFYQGCQYLADHMDPSGVYRRAIDLLATRIQDGYLIIYPEKDMTQHVANHVMVDRDYRTELLDFIESATPGQKFPYTPPVYLSDELVAEFNRLFIGIENLFLINITRTALDVIRVDPSIPDQPINED